MKKAIYVMVLLFILVGCSQNETSDSADDLTFTVEKRIEGSSNYETVKIIDNKKDLQRISAIFDEKDWTTNVNVDMARGPDYSLNALYDIWITPKGDNLEVNNRENSHFARFSEDESEALFQLITGKKLTADEIIQ